VCEWTLSDHSAIRGADKRGSVKLHATGGANADTIGIDIAQFIATRFWALPISRRVSASNLVVPMAMVGIRIVRMRMNQRGVCVPVGVRFAPVPAWSVGMLMMLVVNVSVRVFLGGCEWRCSCRSVR
jgi:hypothetical protein